MVEPVDPLQRGVLYGLKGFPRPASIDDLGLEQADHCFGQSIVVRVTNTADGSFYAYLGQTLSVSKRQVLRSVIANPV